MAIEIIGKLMSILPEQTGVSARGPWKKGAFLIETLEQYPKTVQIVTLGDKADDVSRFSIGQLLKVSINLESREYNGKYYTDAKAWKIDAHTEGTNPQAASNQSAQTPNQQTPFPRTEPITNFSNNTSNDENDLPF